MAKPTSKAEIIAEQSKAFWTVADLFKTEAPPDWRPDSIRFKRELGRVRAAGMLWDLSATIEASGIWGGQFQVSVMFRQEDGRSARGLSARRRVELFQFLEATEKRMWRLRYGGCFDVDRDYSECTGHFSKLANDSTELRRELAKLSSLNQRKA